MSVTSQQHNSPGLAGEVSIHSHSSCATKYRRNMTTTINMAFELIEVLRGL